MQFVGMAVKMKNFRTCLICTELFHLSGAYRIAPLVWCMQNCSTTFIFSSYFRSTRRNFWLEKLPHFLKINVVTYFFNKRNKKNIAILSFKRQIIVFKYLINSFRISLGSTNFTVFTISSFFLNLKKNLFWIEK